MELFLLIYFGIGLYFGGMVFVKMFYEGESRLNAFMFSIVCGLSYPYLTILAIYSIYKDIKKKK